MGYLKIVDDTHISPSVLKHYTVLIILISYEEQHERGGVRGS
jgi:hypothetical protein